MPIHFFLITGQENKPNTDSHSQSDSDSGKGTITSYGSQASLNSASSASAPNNNTDSPEQYEVLKQQKEIWETGIEM